MVDDDDDDDEETARYNLVGPDDKDGGDQCEWMMRRENDAYALA